MAKDVRRCSTLLSLEKYKLKPQWDTTSYSLMLLLLLLSHFSRVRLYSTPQTAAHQAPLSLGFSRQKHWSGLPFLSPMHESETWKWSRSVVSDSQRPHELQPTRLLRPWDFPGKSTGAGYHCLLRWLCLLGKTNCVLNNRCSSPLMFSPCPIAVFP